MSYSEQDGQVVLTMSREDEIRWIKAWLKKEMKRAWVPWLKPIIKAQKERLRALNRLNEGNPNYTSYQVKP